MQLKWSKLTHKAKANHLIYNFLHWWSYCVKLCLQHSLSQLWTIKCKNPCLITFPGSLGIVSYLRTLASFSHSRCCFPTERRLLGYIKNKHVTQRTLCIEIFLWLTVPSLSGELSCSCVKVIILHHFLCLCSFHYTLLYILWVLP